MRRGAIMDMERYIKERRTSFSRQNRTIVDYSVFDFNHVPEKPLIRTEAKQIIDALVQYEKTGIPTRSPSFWAKKGFSFGMGVFMPFSWSNHWV